jgi:hypothetical protein
MSTLPQYQFSQSALAADQIMIIPGILRVPIRRHFIYPKDKFAQSEHLAQYFFNGAKVLELFSCYESILPGFELDTTVGVGFYGDEMRTNPDLGNLTLTPTPTLTLTQ